MKNVEISGLNEDGSLADCVLTLEDGRRATLRLTNKRFYCSDDESYGYVVDTDKKLEMDFVVKLINQIPITILEFYLVFQES